MSRLPSPARRPDAVLAASAGALCGLAIVLAAAWLDGYRHLVHPLGLLGAQGVPRAGPVNVLAFVLPGAIAAVLALRLRGRLPPAARLPARIAPWLLLMSALAFAAQGVFPLDPADLDGAGSRLHAVSWTLWWVAGIPACIALAAGLRGEGAWRELMRGALVVAVAMVLFAALPPLLVPGPVGQRVALVAWLALVVVAARAPRQP